MGARVPGWVQMSADLHTLTGAYAVDALLPEERARFDGHRSACAACRREVAELQATASYLATLLERTPPPALRRRVLDEVDRTRQVAPLTRRAVPQDLADRSTTAGAGAPRRGARGPAWWWSGGLVAAAAALGAVLVVGPSLPGAGAPDGRQDPAVTGPSVTGIMAAPDADELTATGPDGAFARVLLSVSRGEAVLVAHGLEPAPAGHAYALWLIDEERARPAGMLDVDVAGRGERLLEGDLDRAVAIGVTVEPEGGTSQPTSEPVLLFELAHA